MGLREEFERSGNLLFRWRSYLPLLMIGLIVLALRSFKYPEQNHRLDEWWVFFCMGISFLGIAIRIFTVGTAPKGTSGRNIKAQQAEALNTTGMYSMTRNPLYVGNFLVWFGIVLSVRSWWFSSISILIFWLYYERIIFAEEEYLRRKFGEEFLKWTEKTPVFVPSFRRWQRPFQSFNWKAGIGSEYSSIFTVIAVFTVLELAEKRIVSGRFGFDRLWIFLFGFGLLSYVVLRFFKKKTKLLDKK